MGLEVSDTVQIQEQDSSRISRWYHALDNRQGIGPQWQVAVFVASLAAIFSRQPGSLLHAQFFAEDGCTFYAQAYNLQWFRTLGITQAGFLYTLPRLVTG